MPPVAATSTVGSGGYATGLAKRVSASCSAAIATAAPQWAAARIRNPLFFVGSGRSGTNLLASLLASHPAIAVYPYEANDLWHPSSFPWHGSAGETPPIWQDARRFTEASLESRSPRDDRKVRALLGAYETLKGGSCVVNKSAMVTFMIPHIVTAFPDVRFIHLVRDGRAVALSLAKKQIAAIGRHPEYAERGLDLSFDAILDSGARYWASCIREVDDQKRALDLVSRGLIHELTYEDLVSDPDRELAGLAAFAGVAPGGFRYDETTIEDMNRKFRTGLDRDTVTRITELMEPTLSAAGYGTE